MSESATPTAGGVGQPSADTVVAEFDFRPPSRSGVEADAVAAPTYRILRTTQRDAYDAEGEADVSGVVEEAVGNSFGGTARKAAKTSIAAAETEVFADVKDLIETLLAHDAMVHHVPQIETDATSDRVDEEKRNVRVRAFLYAASREDDNDYHLIVGRDASKPPMYLTMELSGLPAEESPHFAKLQAARDAFMEFFGDHLPGTSYDFYQPPIEMDVEGSLFFDMSHARGSRPGPRDLRPDMPVVWEVHPVTRIVLEP